MEVIACEITRKINIFKKREESTTETTETTEDTANYISDGLLRALITNTPNYEKSRRNTSYCFICSR